VDAALADMDGCRMCPENDLVGKVDIVIDGVQRAGGGKSVSSCAAGSAGNVECRGDAEGKSVGLTANDEMPRL
jgi:hypothetical protein